MALRLFIQCDGVDCKNGIANLASPNWYRVVLERNSMKGVKNGAFYFCCLEHVKSMFQQEADRCFVEEGKDSQFSIKFSCLTFDVSTPAMKRDIEEFIERE